MLYFPKTLTKILLIILCATITFHICFLKSKTISAKCAYADISGMSEMQYENFLNSIDNLRVKADFIKNTRVEYFIGLPPKAIYSFYWAYFLIFSLLVFLVKTKLNNSENEK